MGYAVENVAAANLVNAKGLGLHLVGELIRASKAEAFHFLFFLLSQPPLCTLLLNSFVDICRKGQTALAPNVILFHLLPWSEVKPMFSSMNRLNFLVLQCIAICTEASFSCMHNGILFALERESCARSSS
jgi:hypothetical protein